MNDGKTYEPVIGLEIHAQLKTKTKIFCACPTDFEASENNHVCPVCAGMPGSLPVLNKAVVELALKMALATSCRINSQSIFARKNYFYPDLPKGYQISQYDEPLAEEGTVEIELGPMNRKSIGLIRIHLEEDAGKNVHRANHSYVNLNRAGIPLIEIVSKPDLRSAEEAGAYLRELRKMMRYLEICDGNMEEGNLRCDVNVSLRKQGSLTFGTRVEIKNINSFRFVEKAIEYEIERQTSLLEEGKPITQETRLYDSDKNRTYSMRSKEEAHDYRYFPDPDLLPIRIDALWKEQMLGGLPELPLARKERFIKHYGLSPYNASLLTQEKEVADYFEAAVRVCQKPTLVSNWILTELLREINMSEIQTSVIQPHHLGELIQCIEEGTISGKMAKEVFSKMLKCQGSPKEIIQKEGWNQISSEENLKPIVEKILEAHKEVVQRYQNGNEKLFGFLVGQVIKLSKGTANPTVVNQVLKKRLEKK